MERSGGSSVRVVTKSFYKVGDHFKVRGGAASGDMVSRGCCTNGRCFKRDIPRYIRRKRPRNSNVTG